ncbi:MAG: chromosome segregation protein SMC [Desulfobacterales bacterium S5133MH4]|nr:MAG: chromosome segregation protein SMC [Desulfobacterales bacterium S5133MH4]
MKLKQLDIVGFKSFVDRTTVAFPEGISAVVGPNGCGKSNIVDAIRWVMGEQSVKQLRGKSMEDVIFSGTEKRAPLNMAEVTLTLTNDNGNTPEQYREFSEIMVSRRLFRSGESSYLINKQPCRLKDIQDLLMGSGVGSRTYAVIEQARITTLIDAGPDERRLFVEEAAGITRYKSRKNEALRKIERTQQNLVRVDDVITEVKRQINSLKRQARKAERYKTYQKKIERLEVGLATHHYKAICTKIDETESLLQSLRDTDLKHGSQLAKLDAAIEEVKRERAAKDQEITDHKTNKYQLQRTVDKMEGDLAHGTKDLERLITEAEQLKVEIKGIEDKDNEIGLECRHLYERSLAVKKDIDRINETLKQDEPTWRILKDRLAELNQTLETMKAELMDLATRKAAYQNTLQNTSQNKAGLARRLAYVEEEKQGLIETELDRLEGKLTKADEHLNSLRQTLKEIDDSLETWNKQLLEKRQALGHQVRKVQIMEAEKQKIRSRHAALKKMDENYEWYKDGVRAIMTQSNSQEPNQTGIRGLVADVVEAESSYEEAVEAALGETLQCVIVRDQEGGVAAIDYLREKSAGRCGFIPANGLRSIKDIYSNIPVQATSPDSQSPLIDHMNVKDGYGDLIQSLMGHVLVTRDLNAALQIWNRNGFPQTVVTQEGDRLCPQGILIGGSQDNAGSGILSKKREIKELDRQLSQLEASNAEAKSRQELLQTETIALETQIQKARQTQRQKNEEETGLEKELFRLGEEIKHTNHRLKILSLEAEQIKGEETDLDQEFSEYEESLSEITTEIQTTESAIAQKSAEIKEISEGQESLNQKLVGFRLELTKLQAQYDNDQNTLRRLKSYKDERMEKLSNLSTQLKQRGQDKIAVEQSLERNRDKINHLYAELKTVEDALSEIQAEYKTIEGMLEQNDRALSEVRTAQQQALQKIQQLELKQAERRMRLENIVSRIQENYHRDIRSPDHEDDTDGLSVEETEEALTRYRERIAKVSDVNLAAIQEHETQEERYRFLTGQRDDLTEAIESLRRVIRKINRMTLKRFMKTFKAVNEKLQEVFPKLFEGGKARLVLTDPKKPLESGVSFFVHPTGKKVTRMSLLSGGEKALAAIALVFSLFLIKPSAFCVFDEIDAPLDDVNAFRFNKLLRQIGTATQVIVVTHNRQTMEFADALFGVTMEDMGISKLVSISLETQQQPS